MVRLQDFTALLHHLSAVAMDKFSNYSVPPVPYL